MSFRSVLKAAAVTTLGVAIVAAPAVGTASAGQKITPEAFGIHSFSVDPQIPAGSIRLNIFPSWRSLEPKNGQFNKPVMQWAVSRAKAWGYKDVLFVFGNTPRWAAKLPTSYNLPDREVMGPGSTAAPKNMGDWRDIVTWVVRNFGNDIDSYQAWNEVTSPQFFQGTPKEMATMTAILNEVVNKYDRSAKVVSGSVQTHAQAYYDRFAPAYFAALKKKGWPVDVVSGHFYPAGKGGPDKRMRQIAMFKRDVGRAGRPSRVKMWDTEANFWTTVHRSPEPYAGRVKGRKAATYLARNYLDSWRSGLQRSYWYLWTPLGRGPGTDLVFPGVQLRTGDPATEAYNRLAGWTIGSRYKKCVTKGALVTCTFKKGGTFAIAFTTKGKATVKTKGKSVCPVYGGSCKKAKTTKVTTLPVRIG